MTAPLIELNDVTRRYDDGPPALDDVSLTVATGEAVAILGPSGSGKSTLLNLVAGLDRPTAGTVTVDGIRVDTLGEAASARYRRATIGLVFQFFNLLDDLTVLDNVVLPAQLAGDARGETTRRAAELLGTLGIDRLAGAYPGRLSGGERQRVAVARALMNRPALLLADEPTGALDTALRRRRTTAADRPARRRADDAAGHARPDARGRVRHPDDRARRRPDRLRHRAGTAAMSALSRVVRSGVSRRWVQTVVITLATAAAVTSGRAGGRPAGGLERAVRPRLRRPARGTPDGADGSRAGHDRASWLPPPMSTVWPRPPARSQWRRSWCSRHRHRGRASRPWARDGPVLTVAGPDGPGNRCRPGDPDRGTLAGRAR